MSEEQSINIDSRKLFNMGVNILVAGFIRQKPEDAKKLFKEFLSIFRFLPNESGH